MIYTFKMPKNIAIALLAVVFLLPGCSFISKRVGGGFSTSLANAIKNHNDLETVKAAAPSYMLISDSFVAKNPDDAQTLASAAELYSVYAGLFVQDKERAKRLMERAYSYSQRALCLEIEELCKSGTLAFDVYQRALEEEGPSAELSTLFSVGSVWASWIQLNQQDWSAVAQLPKVKALFATVLEEDHAYGQGQAQMYMGVLESLLPPSAGGDLEKAKEHFMAAQALSSANLMVKVLYAQNYARMLFDQDLHDGLLKEVLQATPQAEGLTLLNVVAQKEARALLASSEEYFN